MPPQHVGQVKNRWPAGRAGVENRKHRLEEAIQVSRRNCPATQLQEIVACVPPGMNDSGRKDGGPSSLHKDLLFSKPGSECSRFHNAFFTLMEMHVGRRTTRFWRQRAVDDQHGLAIGVARSAHLQDFPGVAELQLK